MYPCSHTPVKLTIETWFNIHTSDNDKISLGYGSSKKSSKTQCKSGFLVRVRELVPNTLCQDTLIKTIRDAVWVRGEKGLQKSFCWMRLTKFFDE